MNKESNNMIKLKDIVDAFDMISETSEQFINIKNGEVIVLDEAVCDEDNELLEEIAYSDNYIRLPSQYEINEYKIMKDFAYSMENDIIRDKLLNVLRYRHPLRHFKDEVFYLGIREEYFSFREEAYYTIAKEWCDIYGIEFE